jgi:2-polyprenyl-3-methyl-5-hydroxy-6-metoxy-1,4-benzoquinol methylase
MSDWVAGFFDDDYIRLWGDVVATPEQVDDLWSLLGRREGSRVLDAPCGYGRLSRPLAERGALVLGVDLSESLVAHAERTRGAIDGVRLRYRHRGCSPEAFRAEGPDLGGRLGLLAERPE